MGLSKSTGSCIKGISVCLPKNKEDNLELINLSREQKESLVNHTGIRNRFISKNVTIQSLFNSATKQIISDLAWNKDSIDVIIVVTQTSSNSIPAISCKLQSELGLSTTVIAFDINLGCSGYVYGLHVVFQLLKSINKKYPRAILCCGDISSALTENNDLSTRPIFSDAVSATAIEYDANNSKSVSYFNLETFGEGQRAIRTETTKTGNWMRMNGIDVFNYSIQFVPKNIKALLQFSETDISIIDQIILHQANQLINKSILKAINANLEIAPSTLYDYGNTASASIPLTLGLHLEKLKLKSNTILLSGFGVGFSVASAIIKLDSITFSKPIFLDI